MSVSSLELFEEHILCIPLISCVYSPSPIMLVECSSMLGVVHVPCEGVYWWAVLLHVQKVDHAG